MTVKEYLSRPGKLEEEIQRDRDNLAAMRSVAERCTTSLSFTAGRNPSPRKDAFESVMLEIASEEEKIEEKVKLLAQMEMDVLKMIKMLSNKDQQTVMRAKYIDRLTWGNISKKAHVSSRHAQRLEEEALRELEKMSSVVALCRSMSRDVVQCRDNVTLAT